MDHTLLVTLVPFKPPILHHSIGFSEQHELKHSAEVMSCDLVFQHTVNVMRNFISTFSGVPSSLNNFGILVDTLDLWTNSLSTNISTVLANRDDFYIICIFSCIMSYKNAYYLENSQYVKELFLL